MIKTSPKRLSGSGWTAGFCLDLHTKGSTFVGHNEFGHPEFSTTRTEIGDLIYRAKYGNDESALEPIATALADFLTSWKPGIDVIVPVPPSNPRRKLQVVSQLAERLGKLTGIKVCLDCVRKVKLTSELKNVYDYKKRTELLEEAFAIDPEKVRGKRILLFDDLYRSGATAERISQLLRTEGSAQDVFLLTVTRTRSKI